MRQFAVIFLLFFTLVPIILLGKTKKNDNSKDEANKTSFELSKFKYSEINASGLNLIVLGSSGYYFENKNAIIMPFTIYRQDSNLTEKFVSNKATRKDFKFYFDGNNSYERSDGVVIKSDKAIYDEQNKTLIASPAYVRILVVEEKK